MIDELLPVFLYFCGALLLSFILLMEVRNLFRYSFVDSQAFEWRKWVLTFDFFLVLEQTGKKHWAAEQKRSDLYDDANDDSEEVLKATPINMITSHTYSAISLSVGTALYVFATQSH